MFPKRQRKHSIYIFHSIPSPRSLSICIGLNVAYIFNLYSIPSVNARWPRQVDCALWFPIVTLLHLRSSVGHDIVLWLALVFIANIPNGQTRQTGRFFPVAFRFHIKQRHAIHLPDEKNVKLIKRVWQILFRCDVCSHWKVTDEANRMTETRLVPGDFNWRFEQR